MPTALAPRRQVKGGASMVGWLKQFRFPGNAEYLDKRNSFANAYAGDTGFYDACAFIRLYQARPGHMGPDA